MIKPTDEELDNFILGYLSDVEPIVVSGDDGV